MSDSRGSPIPQDRVNANLNTDERAAQDEARMRQEERHLEDVGVDERPGADPKEQPGVPDEPLSPAEGGD